MTASSSRIHLPVRIPMRPDEWPETYLISLARAQGKRKPKRSDIELLRSILVSDGLLAETIQSSSTSIAPHTTGRPQYGSELLPKWAVIERSGALRYCPHCLVEAPYFRTRWRLSGLHACTLHGCLLKSNLFEEAITTYSGRKGWLTVVEAEDADVLDGALCCLPREVKAISMVWRPLEVMAQTASKHEGMDLGSLACWSILLWRLLEVIARFHHIQVIRRPTNGLLAGIGRLIEDLDIATAPSLEGVLALFSRLHQNTHIRTAKHLLVGLLKQEEKTRTGLSNLPLRLLSDRLTAIAPQIIRRASPAGTVFGPLRDHGVSKAALQEQLSPLGAGYETLTRWLKNGQIPSKKLILGHKEVTFIEGKHALRARRAMLSLIHASEFMLQHELDWRMYTVIRDTALVKTGVLHEYLYRQEIAALIARLELMSAPAHELPCSIWRLFRSATVKLVGGRAIFFDLVQAAIQGHVRVFRDLSKPGLSAFTIGMDSLDWAILRQRAAHRARVAGRAQARLAKVAS